MDEVVGVYDDAGRPAGSAPRSRMRAENLRHAATAVVVRDRLGRVLVHRRTETKDVYPGRWDFAAGGVVLAGEQPLAAARRELAEEVGVTADLVGIGEGDYADEHTRHHGHLFETTWDGPVRPQAEEVAETAWVTLEVLAAMIEDPAVPVMPDTVGLLGGWLRRRLADRVEPEQGWDCETVVVEGRFVDRRPRRAEVVAPLLAETRLMPRVSARVGLAVPVPEVLEDDPLHVRHLLVPGDPCTPDRLDAEDGTRIGRFLRRLHDSPPAVHAGTGIPDAGTARRALLDELDRMRERVLPLVPPTERAAGATLLDAVGEPVPTTLVHGDLGPQHLLVTDGRVTGVIDWCDARVADPALDLAWTLHGTPARFADALAAAYGPSEAQRRRGLLWHRLGPWWEVLAGLDHLGAEYVASGLAGVRQRL